MDIKHSFILFSLVVLSTFTACNNEEESVKPNNGLTINFIAPGSANAVGTYAEDGYGAENKVETIQLIVNDAAGNSVLASPVYVTSPTVVNDSTYSVNITIDENKISSSQNYKIYAIANKAATTTINDNTSVIASELALPSVKAFEMSGLLTVDLSNTYNRNNLMVHLKRSVSKVRVRVSEHPNIPSNVNVRLSGIKVQMLNVADRVKLFGPNPTDIHTSVNYINYPERSGATLRTSGVGTAAPWNATTGGQIDSCYIHENYYDNISDYDDSDFSTTNNITILKITVPTTLATKPGADPYPEKMSEYYIPLSINNDYRVKRNYIYTLNVEIAGQDQWPTISMQIADWNDQEEHFMLRDEYLRTSSDIVYIRCNNLKTAAFSPDYLLYDAFSEVKISKVYSSQAEYYSVGDSLNVVKWSSSGVEFWFSANNTYSTPSNNSGVIAITPNAGEYLSTLTRTKPEGEAPSRVNGHYQMKLILTSSNMIKEILVMPLVRTALFEANIVGNSEYNDAQKEVNNDRITMTWAEANGYTAAANNTLMNGAAPTQPTGCAAYWQRTKHDPITGVGKWRMPTLEEMKAIFDVSNYSAINSLMFLKLSRHEDIRVANNAGYWCSDETNSSTAKVLVWDKNPAHTYTINDVSKATTNVHVVRCVLKDWHD